MATKRRKMRRHSNTKKYNMKGCCKKGGSICKKCGYKRCKHKKCKCGMHSGGCSSCARGGGIQSGGTGTSLGIFDNFKGLASNAINAGWNFERGIMGLPSLPSSSPTAGQLIR